MIDPMPKTGALSHRPALAASAVFLVFGALCVFYAANTDARALEGVALIALLARLVYVDLTQYRLPNPITLSLIAIGLILTISKTGSLLDHIIGAIAGYGLIAGLRAYYMWRRGTEGIGLGDAKLVAAIGAWFGWAVLPFALLTASLLGLLGAVAFSAGARISEGSEGSGLQRTRVIPFGPALCIAFAALWLLQHRPELSQALFGHSALVL